eukprot:757975-Amphidinium_carterae.1
MIVRWIVVQVRHKLMQCCRRKSQVCKSYQSMHLEHLPFNLDLTHAIFTQRSVGNPPFCVANPPKGTHLPGAEADLTSNRTRDDVKRSSQHAHTCCLNLMIST